MSQKETEISHNNKLCSEHNNTREVWYAYDGYFIYLELPNLKYFNIYHKHILYNNIGYRYRME